MKLVRDIVSSKQTTETGGRRVLNRNSADAFLSGTSCIESGVAAGGKTSTYLCEFTRVILRNQRFPTPMMDAFNCRGIAVAFYAVGAIK